MTYSENRMNAVKWVLPLMLVAGYLLTLEYFREYESYSARYFLFSALLLGSCALLLTQVKLFEQRSIAVWFALLIFVLVYFSRFYWITIDASPVQVMLPHNPYLHMVASRERLLRAFELSVIAFASFSVSAAGLLLWTRVKNSSPVQDLECIDFTGNRGITKNALWLVGILILVLAYITHVFHIGEMGAAPGARLPFRLGGIVFYTRTILIPLVLLLLTYLMDRKGQIFQSRLAIGLLIIHGVMDMLLRNSRSSLLLVLLLLLFLIVVGGLKLRNKEKVVVGTLAALAFFTIPLMTLYRRMRVQLDMSTLDALISAVAELGRNGPDYIFSGFKFALFRMPGIESIWCMISWGGRPLGIHAFDVISSKNGIAGYLTYAIYPLVEADNTLLAPGFVGWFYLVGGATLVSIGSFFTGVLCVVGWKYLDLRYLRCAPIAKVFFLWVLFLALTEGTLDSLFHMLLAGTITVAAMELCLRVASVRVSPDDSRGRMAD